MARSSEGDEIYNARRRFYRMAQTYLNKAMKNTGAMAERYKYLARERLKDALATYKPSTTQKMSAPIRELAEKLGIDATKRRREYQESNVKQRQRAEYAYQARIEYLKEKSVDVSKSRKLNAEEKRQAEAEAVFASQTISHRILGGLVDLWRDKATYVDDDGVTKVDTSAIRGILFDYFHVDNMADLLDKLEKRIGPNLYATDGDEQYRVVKFELQRAYKDNTLLD